MCQLQPAYVVNDMTLESEYNGEVAVYWSPQSTWSALRGSSSFLIMARALDIDVTAKVNVIAEFGQDGVGWTPRTASLLGTDLYGGGTSTPTPVRTGRAGCGALRALGSVRPQRSRGGARRCARRR